MDNNNILERYSKETIDIDKIKTKMNNGEIVNVYWGTAPTSTIHIGYVVPLLKVIDMLLLGFNVKILIADLHAYLDGKSKLDELENRIIYYKTTIKTILKNIIDENNVHLLDNIEYVLGTSYQLEKEYTMDFHKYTSNVTFKNAKNSGCEVVKQSSNPLLGSINYPLLQSIDEKYLDADLQLGGIDQRKIFMFSRNNIKIIDKDPISYIMTPIIPGLKKPNNTGISKMSASDELSKIDFLDSDNNIKRKLKKAYSIDGIIENNCLLSIIKNIVFPINGEFLLERDEKYGGNHLYENYIDLEIDYLNKNLCSGDIKSSLSNVIIQLISPIREKLIEINNVIEKAYN